MNRLDKLIAYFSPTTACRRQIHRARLERLYQAVQPSGQHRPPRGGALSADSTLYGANAKLRAWARYLDENHDLAGGVLNTLVANVVGAGISVEPRPMRRDGSVDELLARRIREQWQMWIKKADATDELTFSEVQRLAFRSYMRDGEVFAQHILDRRLIRNDLIAYRVELLEADMVPEDDPSDGFTHGVLRDALGRPIQYKVYLTHPGNVYGPSPASMAVKRVPAENMVHLRCCKRVGQTRGVTIFAPVILRLDDLHQYEQDERIAARVAASMTAYIKRSPDFAETYDAGADGVMRRDFHMEAGMVFDSLLPGEDVGVIDTSRPNSELTNFRATQMRAVASGTGTSASSISKEYSGTYSAQRQELVESQMAYKELQRYFIDKFCQPIYEQFLESLRLTDAIVYERGDFQRIANAGWRGPQIPWIDPLKEIQAEILALENKLTSRKAVIRRRGEDPAIIDTEIAADPDHPLGANSAEQLLFQPEDDEDGQEEDPNRQKIVATH